MSHDLFGDPVPHLRKNANGYLADLAELQFEDEWHFWSLAEPDKDRPRSRRPVRVRLARRARP